MKYIVLQCYNGYAVLIDEHSRYVFAANKGYKVGQTVTDPVIMSDGNKKEKNFGAVIRCISAAVACVGILTLCGFSYYSANLKTYSTITIDTASAISMEVNRTGKVIRLVSDTDKGKEIIKNSDVKGMDTVSAANKIIKAEIEKGYISDGETVDVVISGDSAVSADTFKTELETEIPDLDVKVSVHEHTPKKPVKDTAPKAEKEKPVPDKNKDKDNPPLPVTTQPAPAVTTTAAVKTPVVKPPLATLPAETPEPPAKENGKENIKVSFKNVPSHIEVKASPESLKPGEKGTIDIVFNSKDANDWGAVLNQFNVVENGTVIEKPIKVHANVIENFAKLTPDAKANAPVLKVGNTVNVGEVKAKGKKTVKFSVSNEGKSDLIIRKASSNDENIKVEAPTKAIKPGKKGDIKITIANKEAGKLNSRVTIISNDPSNSMKVISLTGDVK